MSDQRATPNTVDVGGLPRIDPPVAAQQQAGALERGVVQGAASGAAVGGVAGLTGGPAAAVTGAVVGALSGAAAGGIVATERGPAGDAVDMERFKDAVVEPKE